MVIYDQIFVDFVGFLSMVIYVVLYTQCLRYNICSARFLDTRISTCYLINSLYNFYHSNNVYDVTLVLSQYIQHYFSEAFTKNIHVPHCSVLR